KAITDDAYALAGTPDLTGGWFDAGDPPKWNPALSISSTMLAWGRLEYPAAYTGTGLDLYNKGNLKWINDYFLKCFRFDPDNPTDVSKYRIYMIVGGSGGESGVDTYRGVAAVPFNKTLNEQVYLSCPHEIIENTLFNLSDFPNYQRPVYYADKDAPATSAVASMAASMASASLVFRGNGSNAGDVAYADLLLERAKMLYNYAKTYVIKQPVDGGIGVPAPGTLKNNKGTIVESDFAGGRWDKDIKKYRPGVEYSAQLCWASLWIHGAELNKNASYGNDYLNQAIEYTDNSKFPLPPLFEDGSRGFMYNQVRNDWSGSGKFNSNVSTMCYVLLAKYCGANTPIQHTLIGGGRGSSRPVTFSNLMISLANASLLSTVSASGMPIFGPTHLTLSGMQCANFCLFVAADKIITSTNANYNNYITFAKKNIDYALGDNPLNRSYLVGFNPPGKTISTNVLHGPSQGFWDGPKFSWLANYPGSDLLGDFSTVKPRHVCYGGLTSPNYDGTFNPNGYDGFNHEVGPTYQKGFEGCLARMVEMLGESSGNLLANFPSPEASDGKEYFVRVKQLASTANSVQLSALIVNHSAWPAVLKNNMSFKYYFTKEPGTTVTVTKQANTSFRVDGVLVSQPIQEKNDLYYVEVSFPNIDIYPGGCKEHPDSQLNPTLYPRYPHHEKEVVFTLTSSGSWDNSNDWSYKGVGENIPTSRGYSSISNIPVYDNNLLLAGILPEGVLSIENPINDKTKDNFETKIYPNPTSDVLNFSIKARAAFNTIMIIDSKGALVYTFEIKNTKDYVKGVINVHNYNPGAYIIAFKDIQGVRTKMFIKK
ncbi:MAG: T9SS C-terminal target domain-containing protein, partial [Sphingobacteriales bacterium]